MMLMAIQILQNLAVVAPFLGGWEGGTSSSALRQPESLCPF